MSGAPDGAGGGRGRLAAGAVSTLAVVLPVLAVAWAADLPRHFGLALYTEQFLAAVLAVSLPLVFLSIRLDRSRGGAPPAYDLAAAVLGGGVAAFVAVTYPTLSEDVAYDPSSGLAVAVVLLVLVVEGLRRTAGTALTVIVGIFLLYAVIGHLAPGQLAGRAVRFDRLATQLAFDPNALLGTPLLVAATIVVVFVLFGHLLNRAGGGRFFTDLSLALMGRFRGGAAKIAILASSLFGSISGSAVSNVVTTGIVTVPLMRRGGFAAPVAGAIEAVASTGGQLTPPIMGASAFLMAEFLQIPYTDVVVAALVPALLYYAALFIQADLRAARDGLRAVDPAEIPPAGRTLRGGWHFVLPFVVLVAALFVFNSSAQSAALYAAGTVLVLGALLSGLRPAAMVEAVRDTGFAVLEIVMITAAAGLIIGVLNVSGLSFALTLSLVGIGESHVVLLLLVAAAISTVLGMGMPTVGVYVLLAALVAPSLVELGVPPLAAHLFVLYFGMMSMITPPVAIAAFAAASLAGTSAMRTGWEAMRFGWPAYIVPFLFALSPALILQGGTIQSLLAVATAVAGVWLVSAAVVGHFGGRLGAPARLAFAAAGAALLLPPGLFAGAGAVNLAGLVAGIVLVARPRLRPAGR